jgi:hypothetical protein
MDNVQKTNNGIKKVVLKRKIYFYLLSNIILQKLDLFLIMRRVWLVRLFPVTVDDIDVQVNASYFQTQGVR